MSSLDFRHQMFDDPEFKEVWDDLPPGTRQAFNTRGLGNPLTWRGLTRGVPADELRDRLGDRLERLKVLDPSDAVLYTDRLSDAVKLAKAAAPAVATWVEQLAQVSDLQLNVDSSLARKRRHEEESQNDLKRLKESKAFKLPAVWKGKKYHRKEALADPKAQQNEEEKQRRKWGKRVVEILLEARLPFGLEVASRGLQAGAPETL